MNMRQQLGELMAILQAWAQNRAPLSALPNWTPFPGCCASTNATGTAPN
jgi:hypothetical protein